MRSEPLRLDPREERRRVIVTSLEAMARNPLFNDAAKEVFTDAASLIKEIRNIPVYKGKS